MKVNMKLQDVSVVGAGGFGFEVLDIFNLSWVNSSELAAFLAFALDTSQLAAG